MYSDWLDVKNALTGIRSVGGVRWGLQGSFVRYLYRGEVIGRVEVEHL